MLYVFFALKRFLKQQIANSTFKKTMSVTNFLTFLTLKRSEACNTKYKYWCALIAIK